MKYEIEVPDELAAVCEQMGVDWKASVNSAVNGSYESLAASARDKALALVERSKEGGRSAREPRVIAAFATAAQALATALGVK